MASSIPSVATLLQEAIREFQQEFNKRPDYCGCGPGRVNLIGEHTDYNDGFVLPMALPLVTLVVGGVSGTGQCRVKTTTPDADSPHLATFPASHDVQPGVPKWANYVKGVVANFPGNVPGFDAVVVSSVPLGGGLSSSASLEVAIYTFLEAITGTKTTSLSQKALVCQKAEHDFTNMPCGIMDQLISVLGKEENALLIDCRSLECTLVPLNNTDIVLVITNSNYHHELTGSEYPLRRSQCQTAAKLLGKTSLRDASQADLEVLEKSGTADRVVMNRARHVIGEIRRTTEGAAALKSGDYAKFGRLMVESHESLRTDYEVSCREVDQLVSLAMEVDGVLGSRITGGGFGGCTITMVHKKSVDKLIANIKSKYERDATFYIATPAEGARIIPLNKM